MRKNLVASKNWFIPSADIRKPVVRSAAAVSDLLLKPINFQHTKNPWKNTYNIPFISERQSAANKYGRSTTITFSTQLKLVIESLTVKKNKKMCFSTYNFVDPLTKNLFPVENSFVPFALPHRGKYNGCQ